MRLSARFWLCVLARPLEVIAARQLHVVVHFAMASSHRRSPRSRPRTRVLDGDVALSPSRLIFRAIVGLATSSSCARETRSPDGASRRIFSIASRVSRYWLLIAQCHIVARLALLHLRQRIGADRGLNRVLNVGIH